ncbi:sulfite exporter TauE/SafE family protein [Wohlfahrtiimonas larvae]|uniref:Urease accessory protein UreH-like transmembrane domain-containing protein n=1 Tax=Wohlfahrtiimonas larvae TaxID=1157986 RepID=A0ABP9N0K5_9GAMM|nr:sulfite exporter TauE/SafE family protein [Wohlfahrtiimonas larvae]
MIDIALLTAVFVVGFNGSLHCFGMCGPVVGILGMNTEAKGNGRKIGAALCYNLGRITTYMLLGVIAMLLSVAMKDLKPLQIVIRYFAGIVMLFVALQLIGFPQFLAFIEKPMSKLSRPISKLTRKFFPIKSFFGAYIAGLAWGLLPCGMVYMAFAMSLGAENAVTAPLVMLFFGLGTLPMMITLSISGNFFGSFFSSPKARKLAGLIVLLMTVFYMGSMLMNDLGKGGMNHGSHGEMNHAEMDHSTMDHSKMDMPAMDHSQMDHSQMNHAEMDHSTMDHSQMDHSNMQH